jgi:hypothetical protein
MNRRRTQQLVSSLLPIGIVGGILSIITGYETVAWYCLFITAAAMPILIIRSIRVAAYANDDRLAERFNAGYSLEHVAAGLLDPPAAPNGPGAATAPNVIHLRPTSLGGAGEKPERKAQ